MQTQPPLTDDTPAPASPLTPAEFEALAIHIKHSTRRLKWWASAFFATMLFALLIEWCWSWWGSEGRSHSIVIAVEVISVVICRLIVYATRKDANEVQRLITFVESTQDIRQLGIILSLRETLGYPSKICTQIHKAANEAIPRLLLLIQSTDADALNSQQRDLLRHKMFPSYFTNTVNDWQRNKYCLAVLSALEQIGDKHDLPDVERLLKEDNNTNEVHVAAERCAAAIRERVARENLKDVLLRPDQNPDTSATLLRPSTERADTPPQQLLRATFSDPADPTA